MDGVRDWRLKKGSVHVHATRTGAGYDDTPVRSDVDMLKQQVATHSEKLRQAVAMVKQNEQDALILRQRCEELERLIRLLDDRLQSASLTIREVA